MRTATTVLRRVVTAVLILLGTGLSLSADVLVLRDGRRVEGVLVAVRGDTIEFETASGTVRRYDRGDIRRIEFDDEYAAGNSFDRRDGRMALRQRTVVVQAAEGWTDSGIDVRGGQELIFAATGTVRWGPNRKDGPAGERNSPRNDGRPMPNRNAAALIGKIGPNGDPFFIGDDTEPLRVRGSGRLFLGINDDYLSDNSGSLRVVISY
jgi:hypothetical protein